MCAILCTSSAQNRHRLSRDRIDLYRDYCPRTKQSVAVGCNPGQGFSKNLEGIFSRRGKQLARSEYRPRVRRKEEEEEEDEQRRGEKEEGTYLVLAAKEGGWKVNYLWKEGLVYGARGKERWLKDGTARDSRG